MRTIVLLSLLLAASSIDAASRSPLERPPFVAHVTDNDLKEAMAIANARHKECVLAAMGNYPIDESVPIDKELIEKMKMDEHKIVAPGDMTDFSKELERRVLVTETPLLTKEECQKVVQDAEAHFAPGEWGRLDSGQYKVAGFWLKDVPPIHEWFRRTVASRLFPLLVKTFPDFCDSPEDLCVDNAYLFKYTPETGFRTNVHTDSGCLAFTIALNPREEYEGGGTWFEGLDDIPEGAVIEMDEGHVTMRPGGVRHCGHAVHAGHRYIIGGFCMHKRKVEPVRQLLHCPPDTPETTLRQTCEAAVALNPRSDLPYNHLAGVYERAGEIAKAQAVLEHCLEHVHPYSGDVAYALASLYKVQNEHEKARECYKTCLKCDEYDFDAMLGVVITSAAMGDKETEMEYCKLIVNKGGASPEAAGQAYCNLGVLSEGTEEEITYFRRAIDLNPTAFAPIYSLACVHATREQWALAVDYFKQSLPLTSDNDRKHTTLKHLYRCVISIIQADPSSPSKSQEELMEALIDRMGKENYDLLDQMNKRA